MLKCSIAAQYTSQGQRRLDAGTNPAVRALEAEIERAFTPDEIATVKAWLVGSAARLETVGRTGSVPQPPGRRRRARRAAG